MANLYFVEDDKGYLVDVEVYCCYACQLAKHPDDLWNNCHEVESPDTICENCGQRIVTGCVA